MNYNSNLWRQINRLTNEVTGSYRSYTPPEPPVVTDTVTITTQPTDVTCYIGDTATFSVVAVSDDETATLTYQWQLYDNDWLNIQGATSSSYTAPTLDEKEVNYRCVITSDKGGTATTDSATLTVEAVPIDVVTITTQPQSATGFIGDTITLSVVAESDDETATLSYQWKADGVDISGATSSTYTAPTSTIGSVAYTVVVTSDKGGTATSNTATVVIENDTVTITAQPQSASAMVGDTVTLSVTATSNSQGATLSYQWQIKNGSTYDDISGATSSTYTVPTATLGTERYRVVVTSDKGGTATSNYADVEVLADTITITAQPQSITLYGNPSGSRYVTNSITATSDDPNATLSYQWQVLNTNDEWFNFNISIDGTTAPSGYPFINNTYNTQYKWDYWYDTHTNMNLGAFALIRCIVTSSSGGTATSNTALVTYEQKTTDTLSGSITGSDSFKLGTQQFFTADVTSSEGLTLRYSWSVANTSYGTFSNATSRTCSFTGSTFSTGTRYTTLRCDVTSVGDEGHTGTSKQFTKSITITRS